MWRRGDPASPPPFSPAASLARALSIAGHPFVLIPLTVAAATRNLFWTAVIAASTTVPLLIVVFRNVRRGVWSDFDVSRRDQRSGLYVAGIPLLLGTAILLYALGASPRLLRAVAAGGLMLLSGMLGNRYLKISMHMMVGAFCAVTIGRLYPWSAAGTFPFLAALAWSRRRLDRHTWPEIAAGSLIGIAAGLFAIL